MKSHDPMHVAQVASVLLSSHCAPERHHVKKAIDAAVMVLEEAYLRAEEHEAKAEAEAAAAAAAVAEPSTETTEGDKS